MTDPLLASEEAQATHPGFTVICKKCGSANVIVDISGIRNSGLKRPAAMESRKGV